NLCRCTGYRPIIEGLKTFTSEFQCCKGENGGECTCMNGADTTTPEEEEYPRLVQQSHLIPFDPTQEPIFPPELQAGFNQLILVLNPKYAADSLVFKGSRVTWYRPASLEEMLRLKTAYPEARIVHGNTEVGKHENNDYRILIERNDTVVYDPSISSGDQVQGLQVSRDDQSDGSTRTAPSAGSGYWAGNIVTSSPISDLNPLFQAVQSRIFLQSSEHMEMTFVQVPGGQPKWDAVGRPMVAKSAYHQATGEAQYVDDIPRRDNEAHLVLVYSCRSHAKLVHVDPNPALDIKGVIGWVGEEDLPGERNLFGETSDEFVFRRDKVTSDGQVIGGILAETREIAKIAAKAVRVEYEDLQPRIITIEEAIKEQEFFWEDWTEIGNVDEALSQAPHVLEGQVRVGGQEHFYLEPQSCIVTPLQEHDEFLIYASTQEPSYAQEAVAEALGIQYNRVTCKVKRIGGGFGGKETRSVIHAIPAAVAARKFGRSVRCVLDRDADMTSTGGRNPFLGRYKVGFTPDGRVLALDVTMYANAGYSLDLSQYVMIKAMCGATNAYRIPNVRVRGYVCKTNISSNTAFRGFGSPQAMMICEQWMQDVAELLRLDPVMVREKNLFKEGDQTLQTNILTHCTVRRCWEECLKNSDFFYRRGLVQKFNRENQWKKRGLAMIPTAYGISFGIRFLNQGGALVHIYTDGSVLLNHGGVEMGQGLHTKMIQVASRALGLPVSYFHTIETSTDTVPNTSPTAASMGSDLNGPAIIEACETLKQRLEPFMRENPKGSWEDWVKAAYFNRVSLSATGYCRTAGGSNWKQGDTFPYYCYGAACSEVEVDCLTGDHKVLRTDIVMDVGESLNPAIDIGQVEGAFIQGYGLFLLEEVVYSPEGKILTQGPSTYKIPGFGDIPEEFNVSLLKGSPNVHAAIGEPPLFLSASIFFAVKEAIASARQERNLSRIFKLDSPATAERIRMACQDQFTDKFKEEEPGTFKPWCIQGKLTKTNTRSGCGEGTRRKEIRIHRRRLEAEMGKDSGAQVPFSLFPGAGIEHVRDETGSVVSSESVEEVSVVLHDGPNDLALKSHGQVQADWTVPQEESEREWEFLVAIQDALFTQHFKN
ncbi:unnamed protein product, partial [Darwinula stevensoni]